jgi:hypothetical protein
MVKLEITNLRNEFNFLQKSYDRYINNAQISSN